MHTGTTGTYACTSAHLVKRETSSASAKHCQQLLGRASRRPADKTRPAPSLGSRSRRRQTSNANTAGHKHMQRPSQSGAGRAAPDVPVRPHRAHDDRPPGSCGDARYNLGHACTNPQCHARTEIATRGSPRVRVYKARWLPCTGGVCNGGRRDDVEAAVVGYPPRLRIHDVNGARCSRPPRGMCRPANRSIATVFRNAGFCTPAC